jgi:ubiquinone/menaquinone biosynthesis C-methylase UbiE
MIDTEYNLDFFKPTSIDHAKNIILTPEDSHVDVRWQKETEWLEKTVDLFMDIDESSVVLDWGCGIGRISKLLIDKYGCKVVGIDIHPEMIKYAKEYVNNDLFSVINYSDIYTELPKQKFTHVFACWVFQHSNNVQYEIPLIYESMDYGSQLLVQEVMTKAIPNKSHGYYDDRISPKENLEKFFDMSVMGRMPLKYTTKKIRDMSWWAVLNKKTKV